MVISKIEHSCSNKPQEMQRRSDKIMQMKNLMRLMRR